ncbi:hypothetical protein B0J12DRAFT_687921 [Macrophomina phaseolina]|uniref:Secreted protein n=1 Tax=Macrophomina phaseolina TaxID=35725 RepID=A0ABQ8FS27_9PEZI|nr:hypothetical protein B0J12DRAFT_687921 [Macrophomina phaseolina]
MVWQIPLFLSASLGFLHPQAARKVSISVHPPSIQTRAVVASHLCQPLRLLFASSLALGEMMLSLQPHESLTKRNRVFACLALASRPPLQSAMIFDAQNGKESLLLPPQPQNHTWQCAFSTVVRPLFLRIFLSPPDKYYRVNPGCSLDVPQLLGPPAASSVHLVSS